MYVSTLDSDIFQGTLWTIKKVSFNIFGNHIFITSSELLYSRNIVKEKRWKLIIKIIIIRMSFKAHDYRYDFEVCCPYNKKH